MPKIVIAKEPFYTAPANNWMSKRMLAAVLAPMILYGAYYRAPIRKAFVSTARIIVWTDETMGNEDDPAVVLANKLRQEREELEQRYKSGEVPAMEAARKAAEIQAEIIRKLDAMREDQKRDAEEFRNFMEEARTQKRNAGMALVAARLIPDFAGGLRSLTSMFTGRSQSNQATLVANRKPAPPDLYARKLTERRILRDKSKKQWAEMAPVFAGMQQDLNGMIYRYNMENEMRIRNAREGRLR